MEPYVSGILPRALNPHNHSLRKVLWFHCGEDCEVTVSKQPHLSVTPHGLALKSELSCSTRMPLDGQPAHSLENLWFILTFLSVFALEVCTLEDTRKMENHKSGCPEGRMSPLDLLWAISWYLSDNRAKGSEKSHSFPLPEGGNVPLTEAVSGFRDVVRPSTVRSGMICLRPSIQHLLFSKELTVVTLWKVWAEEVKS